MWALVLVLVALALVIGWAVSAYNRLVQLQNRFRNAFTQIDVQLKRRYELISNLVETARGYLKDEREMLEAVTEARDRALQASQVAAHSPGDPAAVRQLAGAEEELRSTLARLLAAAKAYPDLKVNQTILNLMEELNSIENRIAFARQAYNDAVMVYNAAIQSFPVKFIANIFGLKTAGLLLIERADERPAAKFSFA